MKKKVIRAVMLGCALFGLNVTNAYAAEPGDYIYAGTNVNIRETPEGEVVGTLPYNAQGVLLEKDEYGWYKIQSGDVIGYVASQYCGDEPFSAGYTKATINSNGLKVRANKNEESNVLEVLEPNTSVEVTEEYDNGAWVSVVTDDNNYGYVSADFVTLNTYYPTAIKIDYSTPQVIVGEEVYAVAPEDTYDVQTQSDPQEEYEEISYDEPDSVEDPIYIEPEQEEIDYDYITPEIETEKAEEVYEDQSEPESDYEEVPEEVYEETSSYEEETPEEDNTYEEEPVNSNSSIGSSIAATACNYIGCSYVWGATGPSSFDCSGLVSYVFNSYGISVPRTAASQYYGGSQIDVSTAVSTPGALIFYHGLGHVAISLGDGSVVHASNSDTGVIVSDAYYSTPDGAALYF